MHAHATLGRHRGNPAFHKSTLLYLLAAVLIGIVLVQVTSCVSVMRLQRVQDRCDQLVEAINNDPAASPATRKAAQDVVNEVGDAVGAAKSMIHSAETGDWKSLALEAVAGVVVAGTAGVAQHKYTFSKINQHRDALRVAEQEQAV